MTPRILYSLLILFMLNGCKSHDNDSPALEDVSVLSADKWTKMNSTPLATRGDAIDFVFTGQKDFLYMDEQYYHHLGSDYRTLSSYAFGNYGNLKYNSFISERTFWNQYITNFGQKHERTTFQQFSTDFNPVTCRYYESEDLFQDNKEYYLQSLISGVTNNLCLVTAAVRVDRGNNPYYYKVLWFDPWGGGKYGTLNLPDSTVTLSTALYLDGTHIYVIGAHCYMVEGFNISQVADLPAYAVYKGSYGGRAFFAVNTPLNGTSLIETSDGITFKETIPGFRPAKVFKPSNGRLICYDQSGSGKKVILIDLKNNTSSAIDANGYEDNNPTGIILSADNRLIMLSDGWLYARKMK